MSSSPPRLAAATALLLSMLAPAAFAQAKIEAVQGKVEVAPGGINVWIAVSTPPYVLKNGDRVRVADKASANIVFPDYTRVALANGAQFGVDKVSAKDAALKLGGGTLDAWVAKGLSKHFRVLTPTAVATAHGTRFHVEVTPTQDTQVEVDDGVVGVTIKTGEQTELGPERPYRSLLVLAGRSLAMLPHPNEDAGGSKTAPGQTDCLHKSNGALRSSVEAIEACQAKAEQKLGALSPDEQAKVREHNRDEIRRFLNTTGVLDVPAASAEADGGDDAAPATAAAAAGKGGRDTAAEHAQLMKELGMEDAPGADLAASMTPEKIKILQGALARQGADPAISAALGKVANGQKTMTNDEMQNLMKSMKLDQIDPSKLQNAAPPADDAAPSSDDSAAP